MLITKTEQTGWVQRRKADGLYVCEAEDKYDRVSDVYWGPVQQAIVWKYPLLTADSVEMVPITVRTYYIVNTSGESYVPPV